MPKGARHVTKPPWISPETGRVDLQFNEVANDVDAIAEKVASARERAEEIADHRKPATFWSGKKYGRTAGSIDAALDFGHFQPWIDFGVDADELTGRLEIAHAFAQAAI